MRCRMVEDTTIFGIVKSSRKIVGWKTSKGQKGKEMDDKKLVDNRQNIFGDWDWEPEDYVPDWDDEVLDDDEVPDWEEEP